MFNTAQHNFEVKRGDQFDQTFTIALDLTDWDVEFAVGTDILLTIGDGITVTVTPAADPDPASSLIAPILTKDQTLLYSSDEHWYMRLITPEGVPGTPVNGTMLFVDP